MKSRLMKPGFRKKPGFCLFEEVATNPVPPLELLPSHSKINYKNGRGGRGGKEVGVVIYVYIHEITSILHIRRFSGGKGVTYSL